MKTTRLASELGERAILRTLVWPRIWPTSERFARDDAAVLPLDDARYLLMSIDAGPRTPFLEHLGIGSHEDLGHYYATMSLSDIAAMGGQPSSLVAAFLVPPALNVSAIEGIIEGILAACIESGGLYVGGDTKEGDSLRVITSAVGYVPKGEVLGRKGLAAGDLICISGPIGRTLASYLSAASYKEGNHKLHRPVARVAFARALAAARVATACIDMSDGPLAAVHELADVNRAHIELDVNRLGFAASQPEGVCPNDWASLLLQVGGDFELMFSVPQQNRALVEDLGAIVCGVVTKSQAEPEVSLSGVPRQRSLAVWENFSSTEVLMKTLFEMVRR